MGKKRRTSTASEQVFKFQEEKKKKPTKRMRNAKKLENFQRNGIYMYLLTPMQAI